MNMLYSDNDLREKYRRLAANAAKKMSLDAIGHQWMQAINNIIREK